jgi:membrane protease YdiL (CAAX protease family)
MLSARPWKSDAIMRFLLSVIICFFAGSVMVAALQNRAGIKFYLVLVPALICLGSALMFLRRAWQMENVLRRLAVVLGCFYGGLVLGAWAAKIAGPVTPSVGQMIINALSLQGAGLVLVIPFLREHETGWNEAFGLGRHWVRAILIGVAVACVVLPLSWLLRDGSAWLMNRVHVIAEPQQVVQTLEASHAWPGRLAFGLITVLLVPPAEETFFRGILYPWVKQAGFPWLALWGTALLFATVHWNLATFVPLLLLALVLTLLYEQTGNLLAPVIAHALFNALNLFRLYLAGLI